MGVRDRYAREFALAVAGVAADPIAHVERYVEATTAPAVGGERRLSRSGIVEGNLVLESPDGTATYARGTDYVETALGFDNLAIPAGTALSADYFYRPGEASVVAAEPGAAVEPEVAPLTLLGGWVAAGPEAPPEAPACRKEGPRVFLSGSVSGGATAEGSSVFSVPSGFGPPRKKWIGPVMTDAGPTRLLLAPAGTATVDDGPFVAGNAWMILEGMSWAWGAAPFAGWGQEDVVFGSEALDVSYGELG